VTASFAREVLWPCHPDQSARGRTTASGLNLNIEEMPEARTALIEEDLWLA
jgi:hypothetical protein